MPPNNTSFIQLLGLPPPGGNHRRRNFELPPPDVNYGQREIWKNTSLSLTTFHGEKTYFLRSRKNECTSTTDKKWRCLNYRQKLKVPQLRNASLFQMRTISNFVTCSVWRGRLIRSEHKQTSQNSNSFRRFRFVCWQPVSNFLEKT